MLRWMGNALASSVGKKMVMGLTGLLLVGYLVEHLSGNLLLVPFFGDADGTKFNEYVAFLEGFGGLLVVAEVGLALLFLCHIYLGFRLTMENREARKLGYQVRNDRGAKTLPSASMFITGALLLAYVLKHLADLRFMHWTGDDKFFDDPYALTARVLSQPGNAVIYMAAGVLVGVHVTHGFQSAFQSLGIHHPRWTPWIRIVGRVLAVVLALGFALIPFYFLVLWDGSAAAGAN